MLTPFDINPLGETPTIGGAGVAILLATFIICLAIGAAILGG